MHDDDAGRDNMCVGGAASELRGGRLQPGRCYRRHQPDQTKQRREKEILLLAFSVYYSRKEYYFFSFLSAIRAWVAAAWSREPPEKIRQTFSVLDSRRLPGKSPEFCNTSSLPGPCRLPAYRVASDQTKLASWPSWLAPRRRPDRECYVLINLGAIHPCGGSMNQSTDRRCDDLSSVSNES